jgi:membrane protein
MATATWHHRGREADTPKEIPASGWKDTLMRVKDQVNHDRVSMVAAAMAYYTLFAFVPALSSVVLIYAWVSDPSEIANHISKASQVLPAELMEILNTQLGALASKAPSKLGFGALFSLLIATWSASKGSKAFIEALNIIYEQEEKRGFIKLNSLALGMTLIGTTLSIIAMGVIVGIPAITSFFHFNETLESAAAVGSWVILLGIFSLFLSFAYRYGPHRDQAKWRWVSWGAVIAAVLWAIASALFSWYAKEFGNFNKTYGSLGAVIVLMTWFYLTSFVILLGAEINAELEHQTKKDTTKGPDRPMGQRGAKMADTLGAAAVKKS